MQKFLGPTVKSIRLDTSKGEAILNQIEPPPNQLSINRENLLKVKFGRKWTRRASQRGAYNCAGLVWASRRTSILKDAEWDKIYEHDGYRTLADDESPMPGDLAVYGDEKAGYFHVGLVIGESEGIMKGATPFPLIVSKWDSSSGEYIHRQNDVPFQQSLDYEVKYWTDR